MANKLSLLYDIYRKNKRTYSEVVKAENGKASGVHVFNNGLILCHERYYNLIPGVDLYDVNVFKNIYEGRNLVTTNQFRALLTAEFDRKFKMNVESKESIAVKDILSVVVSPMPKKLMDNTVAIEFMESLMNINNVLYKFELSPMDVDYKFTLKLPFRFAIAEIPKEIREKMLNIKNLIFDENTGYYSFQYQGLLIPVMCRHEYLLIKETPLPEISIECYLDGFCKYCGSEMVSFNEEIFEELPPKVYSIVHIFINTFADQINDKMIFNILSNLLVTELQQHKNIFAKEDVLYAFVHLFFYKIYETTKTIIRYRRNTIKKFIDDVHTYNLKIGFNEANIKKMVKSDELFKNINNVGEILLDNISSDTREYSECYPFSTMFNKDINKTEMKNIVATNKLQKLWLTKNHVGIKELNQKLLEMVLSKNVFQFTKVNNISARTKLTNIQEFIDNSGLTFFSKVWENYCPATGMLHEVKPSVKNNNESLAKKTSVSSTNEKSSMKTNDENSSMSSTNEKSSVKNNDESLAKKTLMSSTNEKSSMKINDESSSVKNNNEKSSAVSSSVKTNGGNMQVNSSLKNNNEKSSMSSTNDKSSAVSSSLAKKNNDEQSSMSSISKQPSVKSLAKKVDEKSSAVSSSVKNNGESSSKKINEKSSAVSSSVKNNNESSSKKNIGRCINCGLKLDGSNLTEVYRKFEDNITGIYIMYNENILTPNRQMGEVRNVILSDSKWTLDEKYKLAIEKSNEQQLEDLSKFVKSVLHKYYIDKSELIKAINYIINTNLMTTVEVETELLNIYFSLKNIIMRI